MLIISSVNCLNFECVRGRSEFIRTTLGGEWVHLDVTDGQFTPYVTWNDPAELERSALFLGHLPPFLEVHLMVQEPEKVIPAWIGAGASRVIVHVEALHDTQLVRVNPVEIYGSCRFGLALKPETSVTEAAPYGKFISFFQILAVPPGPAGQHFDRSLFEKISLLRQMIPNATIEVDGGIIPDTARLAKAAGADVLVAASYVFQNDDPKKAYEELCNI